MDFYNFLYWMVVIFLVLTAGYQMGKFALEVYDKWGQKSDDTLGTWIGMRVFLFPVNSLSYLDGQPLNWFLVETARKEHMEGTYLLFNTFGAPFRIVWFLFVAIILFLAIPLTSLIFLLIWRIMRDFGLWVKGLFAVNSSTAQPQPSTVDYSNYK